MRITQAFGVEVEQEMDDVGRWRPLPPPPRVFDVLIAIAARDALQPKGHGPKSQKRRSKRRRLRARERFLQRQTWRAFYEREKRERSAA